MSDARTPRQFTRGRWYKAENRMMSALTRAGLIPRAYLLTTIGRKSGQPRSNPVAVVKVGSKRWLVAPFGTVSWVLNARAAGEVRLTRRRASGRFMVRQASAEEAGPVLKRYAAAEVGTREYFAADTDDPVEAFAAEADRHPVFELIPVAE